MGMVRGSCATFVQNLDEIEGVIVFNLDIYLASIAKSMGCIAKSFNGDGEGIMCYLCAKFGRNRRGRRFNLDIYGLYWPSYGMHREIL